MSANGNPATVRAPSRGQRLFLVYTLFILVDLAVLNFFDEFWEPVVIDSFAISFLAAALLQVLFGGLIPFIVVVVTIILTEAALSKIYTMLGDDSVSA